MAPPSTVRSTPGRPRWSETQGELAASGTANAKIEPLVEAGPMVRQDLQFRPIGVDLPDADIATIGFACNPQCHGL